MQVLKDYFYKDKNWPPSCIKEATEATLQELQSLADVTEEMVIFLNWAGGYSPFLGSL